MVLAGLSLIGFFFSLLTGYLAPRKAGWAVILIAPVLGPATFTFIPSPIFPLTTYRVAFAITLGIILRNHSRHGIPLISIFRSTFIKIVFVFSAFIVLISLEDQLENIIFTYIPNLILAFSLCYILIRDETDLRRLVTIFVWQSCVISGFICLDAFTDFNVNLLLMKSIPNYDLASNLQSKQFASTAQLEGLERGGIIRSMGIDGNAVQTGYRLAFLFPLTLFYAFSINLFLKPWRSLPFIMTAIGLYLLYTRAAFVGLAFGVFTLLIGLALLKRVRLTWKIGKFVKVSTMILGMIFIIIASKPDTVKTFVEIFNVAKMSAIDPSLKGKDSIGGKVARIPRAIDHFKERPFTGYGSPRHAYSEVMQDQDLPAPFIYLLAGGVFLFLIYMLMLFYMPYSIFRLSRARKLQPYQKEFLTYAYAAFAGGVIVVFSNWQEGHFMIMYMLYMSIYKIYFSSGRKEAKILVPQKCYAKS